MRLSKPTGTIVRQEFPEGFLCGDETITCGSELYACGGSYISTRVSEVMGVPLRESRPTNGATRVSKPTGTIVKQSEVI